MATVPALNTDDLHVVHDEPRVRDVDIGLRLEFDRPRDIRKLIERHSTELLSYGEVCATVARTSPKGGRPSTEYWLNEGQTLLVCMFARTPAAAEVRRQVIEVFMAWRRGEMAPQAGEAPAAGDPWETVSRRLAVIEQALAIKQAHGDNALASVVHQLPVWRGSGRRPGFWADREVRTFLVTMHRQVTLDDAYGACFERFGPKRTPSRSAIGRFWRRLDHAHGIDSGRSH